MKKPIVCCLLLLTALFLCACASPAAEGELSEAALSPTASPVTTAAIEPSATPLPTATPSPTPFSLLWLSDTQDMAFDYPASLVTMGEWVASHREEYNIIQTVSTGDAVEHGANPRQWANYDACITQFKDIPYFGIAGNHEIGVRTNDYTPYLARPEVLALPEAQKFMDGRAAYTLFSAGGTDFIVLGCGWLTEELAADWMNGVLAAHRDRVAILLFHGVINQRGEPLKVGKFVTERIAAPNANVRLVLCGHVPGTFTRVDMLDSDGDRLGDHRVITSMYNYQLVGRRNGQMRILTFDPVSRALTIATYSPVTNVFYRENGYRTPLLTIEDAF